MRTCNACGERRPETNYTAGGNTCTACRTLGASDQPPFLVLGKLEFVEHQSSVDARWTAKRDGKRQPARRFAYYGGEILSEHRLRQRVMSTPVLAGMAG